MGSSSISRTIKKWLSKAAMSLRKLNLPFIRFYQNIPIRYKLLLVLNAIVIISLSGLSYINYKNSEASLTKKSTQYTQDILKMIEIRLKDYVQNLNILSRDLLPDKRVDLKITDYYFSDSLEYYEESFTMENILKKALFTRDEIQSIALISSDGTYYPADKNNRNISIKNLVNYGSPIYEEIAASARAKGGSPIFYLDLKDGRAKNLFMARMVYSTDTFEEIGVMIFLLRTDYLDSILKDLVNEDMQNIMILSEFDDVIVDRDSSLTGSIPKYYARMKESKGWFLDDSRENIISYLVMDKAPGWKIISCISLSSLYEDIDNLRKNIIMSSVVIVLILSLISLLMTADLVRPFNKLIHGMELVRKGNRDVSIAFNRKDEIGYLGEAFNRMVREMYDLSNWAYQEQLTRKEAEIKALQSQINPHFLFNTLDSVNWMAQLNKVPEISSMVTALSSLIEASIGRDDKLITLREELNYIDNYYLILKIRFEDRIQLVKKIDENALDIKIPRLLIQPLVENAVHHGIEFSKDQGIITLYAAITAAELKITVEDNGEGISRDDLEIINEALSMDNETYFKRMHAGKSKSIGLDNVNRRIKLFYGEHYGLTIESVKDAYTKVVVTLPASPPQNMFPVQESIS